MSIVLRSFLIQAPADKRRSLPSMTMVGYASIDNCPRLAVGGNGRSNDQAENALPANSNRHRKRMIRMGYTPTEQWPGRLMQQAGHAAWRRLTNPEGYHGGQHGCGRQRMPATAWQRWVRAAENVVAIATMTRTTSVKAGKGSADTGDTASHHFRLETVVGLVDRASAAIMKVYAAEFEVQSKADDSPVTAADLAANAILCDGLSARWNEIPILSEEAASPFQPADRPP